MKRTNISLSVLAVASLIIFTTCCAKDSLKDQIFNKHVRNDVLKGLGCGVLGGTVGMACQQQKSINQDTAFKVSTTTSLVCLAGSQAYNYKNDKLSWESSLTQTISTVAGYVLSVKSIEFLLTFISSGSQKPN